jgi:hypothetical protein
MRRDKASCLRAGVISAMLLAGPSTASAETGRTLQSPPPSVGGDTRQYLPGAEPNRAVPNEPDKGISGSSGESLSHQLDRSGGVIHLPTNVDPGLTQPAPQVGPRSMPVIPPRAPRAATPT